MALLVIGVCFTINSAIFQGVCDSLVNACIQWRSQDGVHWGTGLTNLVLSPTKLFFSKSLKIATATLFKEEIFCILTYPSYI